MLEDLCENNVYEVLKRTGQVFNIGTVAAYSAKYRALVAYKILELFQY